MKRTLEGTLSRLCEIVGEDRVLSDPAALEARAAGAIRPSAVVLPAETAEIAELMSFAAAEQLALLPCAGCTKLGIGIQPNRYDFALDLSRMNRVLDYDPQDLTLGVEPGVRVVDLLRVLREQRQFLPLAVPFAGRATLGGVTAANSSSPLRHAYGGIRDFCLGLEFVTGEGVVSKSGGRVVKNVTGYDMHKLLIGSLGTLAVITRLNFRTFPIPPVQRTFVVAFPGAEPAFGFCRTIAESVLAPQIVEVVDPGAARLLSGSAPPPPCFDPRSWSVVVTAAGKASVVERYDREMARMAHEAQASGLVSLGEEEERSVLESVCEFEPHILKGSSAAVIFRIGVLPSAMAPLFSQLRETAARFDLDLAALARASGLLFVAILAKEGNAVIPPLSEAVSQVFAACRIPEIAAQAALQWAPPEVSRSAGSIWDPSRQDWELMRRLKKVFDPQAVLSPGRLGSGI